MGNDARIARMDEKQLRLLRFDFATAKDDIARLVDLANASILRCLRRQILVSVLQIPVKFIVPDGK